MKAMMRLFFSRSYDTRSRALRFLICSGLLLALLEAKNASAVPVIVTAPTTISVSLGQTATFTLVAKQNGSLSPLYVQWRRNGQNIPGQLSLVVPIAGLATSLLILNKVQPSDAGAYSAVVFDADGAVSSASVDLSIASLLAALVNDTFAKRGALSSQSSGSAGANNFNATKEPGEPAIGGKPGGASVWLKWVAPSNGIAQFDTRGSDFDTTLGIYQIDPRFPNVISVTNLISVAGDDDSGNYFNSSAAFNATAGQEYEIAVDGSYGAQGNIVLNWSLTQTSEQLPIILTQPLNVTVKSNSSLTLSIVVNTNANAGQPFCSWTWNGNSVGSGTGYFAGNSRNHRNQRRPVSCERFIHQPEFHQQRDTLATDERPD